MRPGASQRWVHGFHVMVKPIGPICNLDCAYCYYLDKESLYPDNGPMLNAWRMSDATLETFVRDYIAAQPRAPEINFGFQGGEPTLLGLEFFRKVIALQYKYARPLQPISNMVQTNGTLLDDRWCQFFKEHNFLVGLSLDGPPDLHDKYRCDKAGRGTHSNVLRGLRLLQKHGVDVNILCVLNRHNAGYPLRLYDYFKSLDIRFIQFIPIVEHVGLGTVSDRSILPEQYGSFLTTLFDEWIQHDVGNMFINLFDVALQAYAGETPSLCVHAETCGGALALEHNGDLYACDHFVEPRHLRGNIQNIPLPLLIDDPSQDSFGTAKRDSLPAQCRTCSVRFLCHGGCPKDRFSITESKEPGLNYLCAGYKHFFTHIDAPMRQMKSYLERGLPASSIMSGPCVSPVTEAWGE